MQRARRIALKLLIDKSVTISRLRVVVSIGIFFNRIGGMFCKGVFLLPEVLLSLLMEEQWFENIERLLFGFLR